MASKIIESQGTVQTTLKMIYGSPIGKMATIETIIFNNTDNSAYEIEVWLYRKSINKNNMIYRFSLDAGDYVEDSTIYNLKQGDFISAKTNTNNTTYIIMGNEADQVL